MNVSRSPVKKSFVANKLRGKITSGELVPGERIPTRREISESFSTTLVTVQQALASLENDGFVVSKGKLGTFVSEKPPHLNQFALVFPCVQGTREWGLYWDHLVDAAHRVTQQQGNRLSIYTGINAKEPGEDYEALLDDIEHDRIAGLMFASSPFLVDHTPIIERPGIPRVIMGEPNDRYANSGYVNLDMDCFARKACSWLTEQGCSTAAILQQPGNDTSYLLSQIEAVGVDCPYQWQQSVSLEDASWARNVMRLLFDGGGARPDALIVTDDNLFEPGLSGILDAGVRIPHDLKILTHSNFPWTTTSPVPTTRLGYDMNELLKEFISELESQRAGNAPQRRILEPVFESEINSR